MGQQSFLARVLRSQIADDGGFDGRQVSRHFGIAERHAAFIDIRYLPTTVFQGKRPHGFDFLVAFTAFDHLAGSAVLQEILHFCGDRNHHYRIVMFFMLIAVDKEQRPDGKNLFYVADIDQTFLLHRLASASQPIPLVDSCKLGYK